MYIGTDSFYIKDVPTYERQQGTKRYPRPFLMPDFLLGAKPFEKPSTIREKRQLFLTHKQVSLPYQPVAGNCPQVRRRKELETLLSNFPINNCVTPKVSQNFDNSS